MVNFPGHGKAYAEYVAAPANQLALKPKNISLKTLQLPLWLRLRRIRLWFTMRIFRKGKMFWFTLLRVGWDILRYKLLNIWGRK
jgi:hypothetical protein